MRRPPAEIGGSIFAGGLGRRIGLMSFVLTVVTLVAFYVGKFVMPGSDDPAYAHSVGQTMAFIINAWSSVVNSYNIRSYKKSLFTIGFKSNRLLMLAAFCSVGVVFAVATVPGLRDVFYCVPLGWQHWLIVLGLSLTPLPVGEVQKAIFRRKFGGTTPPRKGNRRKA